VQLQAAHCKQKAAAATTCNSLARSNTVVRCALEGSVVMERLHALGHVLELSFLKCSGVASAHLGKTRHICMLPPPELEARNTRAALHMRRLATLLHNTRSSAHAPQVVGNRRALVVNSDFQRCPAVPALRCEACARDCGAARCKGGDGMQAHH
jgi:hypothetical protein